MDSELKPGHIYDSNKIMLMNLLEENHMKAVDLGIVHDEYVYLRCVSTAKIGANLSTARAVGTRLLLKLIIKINVNFI